MAVAFNPYGLHAIRIPLAMITYDGTTETRKALSWGAKVFYGRLGLFLGRPKAESFCNPNLETMAGAMRTSTDTIGRWLEELAEHGFIERRRKGRGAAECVFLPHPCLVPDPGEDGPHSAPLRNHDDDPNSASSRNQSGSNSAILRNQKEAPIPQNGVFDSAPLPLQFRNSAAPIPQLRGLPYKEENIQENVHQNVHGKPLDDSSASRKTGAKTQESAGYGPKPPTESEKKKPTHSAADREMLRTVMAKHLSRVIGPMGLLEPPDDGDLDRVLAALDSCPVDKFCAHLQNMPAKYQGNGRSAPRGWAWFAAVAGNFAGTQVPQPATSERCRHGKPFGVCCNHPDEDDARSDSFSTLDRIQGAA